MYCSHGFSKIYSGGRCILVRVLRLLLCRYIIGYFFIILLNFQKSILHEDCRPNNKNTSLEQ